MRRRGRQAPRFLAAVPVMAATLLLAVGCGGSASPRPSPSPAPRASPATERGARWVVAWSAAMEGVAKGPGLPLPNGEAVDQTLRLITPLTASGNEVRIELSNVYGTAPVTFSAITAAVRASGAAISSGSLRTVSFAGHSGVTIPGGAVSISDPVSLNVQAGDALAVSAYIAGTSPNATWHLSQPTTSYFTPTGAGDQVTEASGASFTLANGAVPWLTNVDVLSHAERGAVVVLGDSLTDGSKLPPNQGARWTDVLAGRLQALPAGRRQSVANEGIGGDGLTPAGSVGGVPSGESRFERDVLQQPGVDAVIIELGINDLAAGVSAETIEQALSGLVARAKQAGLRVLIATVPPAALIPTVDRSNQLAVNRWILTHTARDDVVNLATTLGDPSNPGELNPAYDSGDHVHPNTLGDRAIGDSVSLDALER